MIVPSLAPYKLDLGQGHADVVQVRGECRLLLPAFTLAATTKVEARRGSARVPPRPTPSDTRHQAGAGHAMVRRPDS